MDNDLKYLFNITISKIKEIAQENSQKIFSGGFGFILKIKCYRHMQSFYSPFFLQQLQSYVSFFSLLLYI